MKTGHYQWTATGMQAVEPSLTYGAMRYVRLVEHESTVTALSALRAWCENNVAYFGEGDSAAIAGIADKALEAK